MIMFTTSTGRYLVMSHGNGWAYTVRDNKTHLELWVQDDDATQLQLDTNDFEDEAVLAEYFSCLGDEN